ncbi:alpha-L-fucosidase 1 [Colletotrichum orchidophilum]|uniref:alpha-L-fucosidase n=1 Tax=Colletotrichum orchidophilum TaxID=1209926 RepID=A0A1G4BT53_9PEZI|nr:alpha-L-fucosidase 1 [Colletotrichum orchidophilum]OHF04571.1 alpha-L-fucosidase 1 [Colletotrichum orchidophilum]
MAADEIFDIHQLLARVRKFMGSLCREMLLVAACLILVISPTNAQAAPSAYLQTPVQRQLDWHCMEYYAFIHFGPNTFTNEEWGTSQQMPDVFNPTALDTDQWAKSFADAGMSGMILTAKHHDGMALWNTSTTTYKIANGGWAKNRTAAGLEVDVVRMAAVSAKKYGLKFGVYLSPWDIHRDPAMPKPLLNGTIFDEPQIFGDNSAGDYNDFYRRQLTELVDMTLVDGSSVSLFEIWLDGASGSSTVQTFDWAGFRDIIRTHQPAAIMWGHQGVDARWVGNEDGVTVPTNWHTISRTQDQERLSETDLQTGLRDGLHWTPAEADARVRTGWFWHADEQPKTGQQLLDMYFQSVGRSVSLLLDVPPDASGRITKEDIDALMELKRLRDDFLGRNLVTTESKTTASSVRGGENSTFGPSNVLSSSTDTYWSMNDEERTGWLDIDLNGTSHVDAFVVQEHVALGQRVGGYNIDCVVDGTFKTVVNGTSLGYKRIDRLETPVETTQIRFRVTQANAVPLIQNIQVLGTQIS